MEVTQTMTPTVDERLIVEVATGRMVHGTEFKRITKAVHHLYYLSLFTQTPQYQGSSAPWASWLAVGTDLAVREAPRVVDRADRYLESVHSGPREIRIAVNGNRLALDALARVLASIEAVRTTVSGQDAADRTARVLGDPAVQATIAAPLAAACRAAELTPEHTEHFATLLRQSIAALTATDVVAVNV
jgi:hypothetical protein